MQNQSKDITRFIYLLGFLACCFWVLLGFIEVYRSWDLSFYDEKVMHQWPLTAINYILTDIFGLIAITFYSIKRSYFGITICALLAHVFSIWFTIEMYYDYDYSRESVPYYEMIYYAMNSCWILFYCSILLSRAVLKNRYLLFYALLSIIFLALEMYYGSRMVYQLSYYLWIIVIVAELFLAAVYWQTFRNPQAGFSPQADPSEEE